MIKKQPKLSVKTKEKLKVITKSKDITCITEDARFALEINGEITGKEVIKKFNSWKRS